MKGKMNKPKSCPECGGDLKWDGILRVYICTSCGLEMTEDKRRELQFRKDGQERDKDWAKEYVDWWFKRK